MIEKVDQRPVEQDDAQKRCDHRPFVDLFDQGGSIAGIPASVAYVFGAWAALIGLLAWAMRPRPDEQPNENSER